MGTKLVTESTRKDRIDGYRKIQLKDSRIHRDLINLAKEAAQEYGRCKIEDREYWADIRDRAKQQISIFERNLV